MRLVEKRMRDAIVNRVAFKSANTEVVPRDYGSDVYLHGNCIATTHRNYYGSIIVEPVVETLRSYPTRTTMSRLRALGVNVCQRGGKVYLNGSEV